VENLVGHGDAIQLVFEDDLKVVIPLFMTYFETLNPIVEACTSFGHGNELENESNIFGVGASFEESSRALVTGELSLFQSHQYLLLHVKILLLDGTTMKGSF
jgi:hypothetical protein